MKSFLQYLALKIASSIKKGGVIINNHTQNKNQIRLQIDVLGQYFEFIHHNELPKRIKQKKSKPFCLMTFDDGKKINATETAIELERSGVPSVFYLTTDCINTQQPHWFDFRNCLEQKLPRQTAHLQTKNLKRLSISEISEKLEKMCIQYNIQPDCSNPLIAPMNWEDVCELDKKGFTIGAHSTRHAILTNETNTEAETDIKNSINDVSRHIGRHCSTFAFPNGNYTMELADHAIRCGAKTVMTTDPTWVKHDASLNYLPRIQLYNRYTHGQIQIKIAVASPGIILKNPNGLGRQYVINHFK